MVICLERGADLHMAQLMPLPLTVSCFNKIQIGFTFLVPTHPGSPEKGALNGCVRVYSKYVAKTDRSKCLIKKTTLNLDSFSQCHLICYQCTQSKPV